MHCGRERLTNFVRSKLIFEYLYGRTCGTCSKSLKVLLSTLIKQNKYIDSKLRALRGSTKGYSLGTSCENKVASELVP